MERELLIRQVPHSIEAEQAVLGSIVIDPACVPTVLGMLSPDDFYIDVHKMIYETVVAMFTMGKKIDYVTILDEIKMSGNKGKVDRDFFLKLVETTPTSANVEQYADIVRGKSMLRDLQSVSSEIMELTKNEQEDPQNVAELAEQKVYSVRQGREIKGLISLKSAIKDVYCVTKAYSSCVGAGPFTTELFGEEAKELRDRGGDAGEYGATTGRPRRVGWFDAVATRYGCMVQGATEAVMTNLDVLGYLDQIPVCTAYEVDGKTITDFPSTPTLMRCKPVYTMLPGWKSDVRGVTEWDKLPENCKNYITFIEKELQVPIHMISTGPKREEMLYR